MTQVSEIPFPCLITVDKDSCVPRLPSYILKKKTEGKEVRVLGFSDLPSQDMSRYGLVGSPTTVERMFALPAWTGRFTWREMLKPRRRNCLTY